MNQTQFEQRLMANKEAISEFLAGPVWQLWLDLAEVQIEAHTHNAVFSKTLEEREEARLSVKALQKFKQIPFAIVRTVETISASAVVGDKP